MRPGKAERQEQVRVVRMGAIGPGSAADDIVAVEEPLEIRVGDRSLVVTMRTPGHDLDLARGLLFTEGLVERPEDIAGVVHCDDVPEEARGNVVTVTLAPESAIDESHAGRTGIMSASCGVCGKSTLESISVSCPMVSPGPRLDPRLVLSLPAALRKGQSVFDATGGLHAAGLFAADGRRLGLAEDVGRHNAVDKVVGEAVRFRRLPLSDTVLMVSGRASFEIVQKARRAGIPVVAAVSAPSSLAVSLARDGGQTLIGFVRKDRFNVYTGAERLGGAAAPSPEPT